MSLYETYGYFEPARLANLGLQRTQREATLPELWPPGLPGDDSLDALGLGLYRAPGLRPWLFGSTDESLHRHERWLYMWQPITREGRSWYRIQHHRGVLVPVEASDFSATLFGWYTKFTMDAERINGRWTAAHHWRSIAYKFNVGAAMIPALQDARFIPADLHELVFHYPRWLAHNPEYTDMPRELVWRMHGLGQVAQLAAANRAGGSRNLGDDDAFRLEPQSQATAAGAR